MLILVINSGSSSVKYQLLDPDTGELYAKGLAERIGIDGGRVSYEVPGEEKRFKDQNLKNHKEAMRLILDVLVNPEIGVLKSFDEINAVGHRIVSCGEKIIETTLITEEVVEDLENLTEFAPLHNPAAVQGIRACQEVLPNTPMSIVIDTSFHQTMPNYNYIYALPYEYYEEYKIRRYGAHGTSHKYVALRLAEILNKDIKDLNLITCHLGNGSSVTAIKNGKVFDTSMGFTPLAGVAMGTRTGDLDPSVVTYIENKENLTPSEMDDILNKKSGILGISGVSSDFRDVEDAANEGNERAELALQIFAQTVRRFIGSYLVELGRIDGIIFTAGLGENSPIMRTRVLKDLENLGIELDEERNEQRGENKISSDQSEIGVWVIPTNEELMIARETKALLI